jgi:hypothetical protein
MPSLVRALFAAALILSAVPATHAAGPTRLLNDTGQTLCDDGTNNMVACTTANTGNTAAYPRQDGRFGRDAKATAGSLTKTGGGAAGFDFTALDASGAATTPNGHACVKDNVTNLIWSTETLSNTWADAATAATSYSRCGFGAGSGWRVPTRRELLSIVHNGAVSPAIDTTYFPGTASDWYWTSDTYAPVPAGAWYVNGGGGTFADYKSSTLHVRLVRSGQ